MKKKVMKISLMGILMIGIFLCLMGPSLAQKIEQVRLEKEELNLPIGESSILLYTISPTGIENITHKIWLSHNPNIAQVDDNGKVTAKEVGTTEIELVLQSKEEEPVDYSQTAKCKVIVHPNYEGSKEAKKPITDLKEKVEQEGKMDLKTKLTSIVWVIGLIVILILIGTAYDKKRGKLDSKENKKQKETKKDE